MIFKVNTKTNKITAVGFDFEYKLTTEMKEFYRNLENLATTTSINVSQPVTHIKSHDHYILFGHVELESDDSCECIFKEHFRFDLQTYTLLSPENMPFNPRLLQIKRNKQIQVMEKEDNMWILRFYRYWYNCIYPSSSRKENIWYLFEELTKSCNSNMVAKIKTAEKLYRSGFNIDPLDMGPILTSLSSEELNKVAGSPWALLNVPKYVYKDIVSSIDYLKKFSTHYGVKHFRTFKHWDLTWNNVKSVGALDKFIDLLLRGSRTDRLIDLLDNKQYNAKRLMEYIYADLPQKQGFENTEEALEQLAAYASMMEAVDGEILEKYPKHLKTEHDVAVAKFNRMKIALNDTGFLKAYENGKGHSWEYTDYAGNTQEEDNRFKIQIPTGALDVVEEGKNMHHCVATYVDLVSKDPENRAIVFLRRRNPAVSTWSSYAWLPALTIEIHNGVVVQARGKFNRDPEPIEFKFLKKWLIKTELEFSESLKSAYKRIVGEEFKITKAERKELCAV